MAESTATEAQANTVIVHHLNNSRSQRVLWLLVRFLVVAREKGTN
jgi:hypothetical protein